MKNKCKKCNKEFEASTKIKYCSIFCNYGIKQMQVSNLDGTNITEIENKPINEISSGLTVTLDMKKIDHSDKWNKVFENMVFIKIK